MNGERLQAIGETARQAATTVATVRYYDDIGLVTAAAREGGRRLFAPEAAVRLRAVAALKQAGFSLNEIGVLLGDSGPSTTRRLLLDRKLEHVNQQIRNLKAVARALNAARTCGCIDIETCTLLAGAARADMGAGGFGPRTP